MSLFKKEKPRETTPKELQEKVRVLEERLEQTKQELKELKAYTRKALTKVGVVRFNPFKEIGGDQSFSIALLDGQNNGTVVTSYYGRELNRVYAKEVRAGKSEHELSQEEKQAIQQAISAE